jgi:hypothetical protein
VDDFPALLKEIYSNDGLAVRILNRMEGFAMYFACGIADGDKAYWPAASVFCNAAKTFLPYLILAHEKEHQFTYTLALYGAWGSRQAVESLEKDMAKHKERLSKITIPKMPPIGTRG